MKKPFILYGSILLLLLAVLSGVLLLKASSQPHPPESAEAAEGGQTTSPDDLQFGSWPALGKKNFFGQVREKLIQEETRFIEADLSSMRVRVYEGDKVLLEVPIRTKGREGSWWQTPVGLYKVESKEREHFSSFGKVYQPWSMAFQGNFFIHGWPYHPSGEPVSSQYSGGCIRLEDADAEEIYKLVEVGTPVLVFEEADANDGFTYTEHDAVFSAGSFLVSDTMNSAVLATKNSENSMPMGAATHLLAALVTVEYANIEHNATIPDNVAPDGRLIAGEDISIYDLLHLVLGEGDEDALDAIAAELGRKRFVNLMNTKAAAIGMRATHIESTRAGDSTNTTTAEDLFALGRYLANNRSFLLRLTYQPADNAAYDAPTFDDIEYDKTMLALPGFRGGVRDKEDGMALGVFNVKVGSTTRSIIAVTLDAPTPSGTLAAMRTWLATSYE